MRLLSLFIAICLMAANALAAELNWQTLVQRPELWPAHCALKQPISFQGGVTIPAGQSVDVIALKGNEIDLQSADGRTSFIAEPDETDILAAARAGFGKLTPKQQTLTYPLIAQRKELWPYRVAITRSFHLDATHAVSEGDQVLVKEIQPNKLLVVSEKLNARFNVLPQATDVMAQARNFVEDEQAGPRYLVVQKAADDKIKAIGRVVIELDGKLINSVTGQPEPLDANALPRYIVFLRGSSGCPITRGFAPKLIKFYQEMKPAHPDFEVVYLTVEPLEDTEKFAKEIGFSWRSVSYDHEASLTSLRHVIDGRLPQLIVMDRSGKVLANGLQSTAPTALAQLDALLKAN